MTDWTRAACIHVPSDVMFPDDASGHPGPADAIAAAKQVCADCPITADCLEWALARRQAHGVWGGLDATERRRLAADRGLPTPTTRRPTTRRWTA